MVITELYMKNFGKFSEERIRLHDGLQVISGENEYGKSTIHAFIRAMLFGMERGRGRAAARDDFSRYEPWENPEIYGGAMRFRCGGRNFRLERSFRRPARPAVLVCEDDGEELSVEQGDLDMLLGGLTEGLFDSTVSVGQLKAEPGKSLAEALENYAANYCETAGGELDLNAAFRLLKEKRRAAEKKLREAEEELEAKRQRTAQECAYLERDMASLSREYEDLRRREEALPAAIPAEGAEEIRRQDSLHGENGHEENLQEETFRGGPRSEEPRQRDRREDDGGSGSRSMILAGAGGIFAGLLGLLWGLALGSAGQTAEASAFSAVSAAPMAVIGGIIAVAGAAVLTAGLAARRREREERWEDSETDGIAAERDASEERKRIGWEMERIRSEWKETEIRCSNLREREAEFAEDGALREKERRIRILSLAEEELRKAAEESGGQTAQLLNRKASEIFSALTDGRYRKIRVGEKQEISVWDGVRNIPARRLSRGTLEQIWFSVRMAAAELLLEEPVPVLLDEVFAFYDEKRLKSALKWLSGQKKQVIIFTCHKREDEIVKKEDFS